MFQLIFVLYSGQRGPLYAMLRLARPDDRRTAVHGRVSALLRHRVPEHGRGLDEDHAHTEHGDRASPETTVRPLHHTAQNQARYSSHGASTSSPAATSAFSSGEPA